MLSIQEYIKNHTIGQLREEHGIEVSINLHSYKFSLNYSQILAKSENPLANQCRGLVLRTSNGCSLMKNNNLSDDMVVDTDKLILGETKILAAPFFRFFNYGDPAASKINWNTAKVVEKLDGSLCICYFDDIANQWHIATRSVPEANIPLSYPCFTFRTLFEKALNETLGVDFKTFVSSLSKNRTYCFELTSPYNRIVVSYKDCRISLLGVRDNLTLEELNVSNVPECKDVPKPKEYSISNIDDIVSFVNGQNPSEFEGVVIVDNNFNRIKVKSLNYVLANRVSFEVGHSDRACLSLILEEKDDDILIIVPEHIAEKIKNMKDKFHTLNTKYSNKYNEIYEEYLRQVSLLSQEENNFKNKRKIFASLVNSKAKDFNNKQVFYLMAESKAIDLIDYINLNKKNDVYPKTLLDSVLQEL